MKRIIPLLCLLALVAACIQSTDKTPSQNEAPKNISNKGVDISFDQQGNGDTTLLFVHGWAINKSYWQDQVAYYRNRYRVVTIDLPGFGQSGKNRKDWSVAEFGTDVDSVMSQLNLKNVVLIGHSMSGDVVLEAAIHAPGKVLGIIGIDNFKNFGERPDSNFSKNYAKIIDSMRKNYTAVVTEYFSQQLFYKTTDSAIRKRILNDVFHGDSTIAVDVMAENNYDEIGKAKEYRKPIYLVNSDVTPTDTLGFKREGVPYSIELIHATGHYPMVEKPQEFNRLLEIQIRKILDARG